MNCYLEKFKILRFFKFLLLLGIVFGCVVCNMVFYVVVFLEFYNFECVLYLVLGLVLRVGLLIW